MAIHPVFSVPVHLCNTPALLVGILFHHAAAALALALALVVGGRIEWDARRRAQNFRVNLFGHHALLARHSPLGLILGNLGGCSGLFCPPRAVV